MKIRFKPKGRPSIEIDEADLEKYMAGEPVDTPAEITPAAPKAYSEQELYALNKADQVALITALDADASIPSLEAGRVAKLLDLGATK